MQSLADPARGPRRCGAARRPVPAAIWVRHEKPSATSSVSAGAARTCGQQELLADRHRDLVLLAGVIAERAGHAAATGVRHLGVDAGAPEQVRTALRSPPSGGSARGSAPGARRRGGSQSGAWRSSSSSSMTVCGPAAGHARRGASACAARRGTPTRSSARARAPARPSSIGSDSASSVSRSVRLASVSMPKSYRGRPQQSRLRGSSTANPAASSTSDRGLAGMSGSNRSVNVSGQRTTRRPSTVAAATGSRCEPVAERLGARTAARRAPRRCRASRLPRRRCPARG